MIINEIFFVLWKTKQKFWWKCRPAYEFEKPRLTLIRMTKDEKGLAFFKGLLLLNVLSVKKLKK